MTSGGGDGGGDGAGGEGLGVGGAASWAMRSRKAAEAGSPLLAPPSPPGAAIRGGGGMGEPPGWPPAPARLGGRGAGMAAAAGIATMSASGGCEGGGVGTVAMRAKPEGPSSRCK